MKRLGFLIVAAALSGCATLPPATGVDAPAAPEAVAPEPVAVIKAPKPAPTARTAEQFDTTTAKDRAAAAAPAKPAGETSLGTTIASLGNPADPGFWMETPLVTKVTMGRISYGATGKSATVELRPIDGPKTAGSRLSLPAFRLLDAPLTGLPELAVFAN